MKSARSVGCWSRLRTPNPPRIRAGCSLSTGFCARLPQKSPQPQSGRRSFDQLILNCPSNATSTCLKTLFSVPNTNDEVQSKAVTLQSKHRVQYFRLGGLGGWGGRSTSG
jgi:hypothetical protein